ncbi:glycosyltransferase family 4 protein [Candidatus Saccharibacteria bacterium]|nr:glycosyltransferase family 4 protein [Candidatus Saccharibacteria bacterium]
MLGWELPPHNSGGLGVACYHLSKALAKNCDLDFVLPYSISDEMHRHMRLLFATENAPDIIKNKLFATYDASMFWSEVIKSSPDSDALPSSIRELQSRYMNFLVKHLASRRNHPDVVHSHDWLTFEGAVFAREKHNLPFVAHVHATEFDRAGGSSGNPLVHEIEYAGLRAADHILAVSDITKNIITDKYGIPKDKITVVHNGWVEPSHEAFPVEHLENLKKRGHTIITTVARLTLQKGLSHLLEAFAMSIKHNPKMTLIIAGSGEEKANLIDLTHNLKIGNNVIFTDFLAGQDLQSLYLASDVFVMSSVSEPFGLTALEAAHQGDALVITKQSGVSEILSNVFVYDFWDTSKLADIMVGISLSKGLLHTLQSNIKTEYNKISWDDVANKTLSVYNDVVKVNSLAELR